MNKIEIWSPRWHDRKVLIAKYKVGVNNEIVFTRAKNLSGITFTIRGADVERFPIETNGTIPCYAVDFDALEAKK